MTPETQVGPTSKKMMWGGYVVSAVPVLLLLMGAFMSLTQNPQAIEGTAHLGYPESLMSTLGILQIILVVVYAIPQTAVLGAILLTGYFGGATASHVRIGEPFYLAVIVGVLVWLGLFLRDARIRELVPWRR